jgi:hypothetical protein
MAVADGFFPDAKEGMRRGTGTVEVQYRRE